MFHLLKESFVQTEFEDLILIYLPLVFWLYVCQHENFWTRIVHEAVPVAAMSLHGRVTELDDCRCFSTLSRYLTPNGLLGFPISPKHISIYLAEECCC